MPRMGRKVIILVAEDSPTHAFHIRELLEKNGYAVEIVKDGQEAREALETRERDLRTILETSMDGYWALDFSGRITDVNDAYCKMAGYTRDELLQMSIPDLEPFEDPQDTRQRIERIRAKGAEQFEACHRTKDGRVLDMEISASCPHPKEQVFCFCRDITERKEAEYQQELQSRLQRMLLKISSSFINATLDQIDHLIQAALRDLVILRSL